MLNRFLFLCLAVFLFLGAFFVVTMSLPSSGIQAQSFVFSSNTRIRSIAETHTTVGTTTAVAITASLVGGDLLSWQICNDATNTSTHLLVGADPNVSGRMLGKGDCLVCENCTSALLKTMQVEGQAASNGYSVFQFKR